jgi:hypothetical protein
MKLHADDRIELLVVHRVLELIDQALFHHSTWDGFG